MGGRIIRRERNFYGILRVTEDDTAHVRRLFHGWTLHGEQSTEPGRDREPTTYYLPGGPASQVFEALRERGDSRCSRVAIVGLGIGGLAPYARPGQAWTFYELDPAVEAIARDASLFTYLRDCPAASVDVVLGDARLRLADAPDGSLDLIVLDAFSSDAIPVHLLTREALTLYLSKRAPAGVIAYHISTRHLDLEPILGALASERGLIARIRRDVTVTPEGRSSAASSRPSGSSSPIARPTSARSPAIRGGRRPASARRSGPTTGRACLMRRGWARGRDDRSHRGRFPFFPSPLEGEGRVGGRRPWPASKNPPP